MFEFEQILREAKQEGELVCLTLSHERAVLVPIKFDYSTIMDFADMSNWQDGKIIPGYSGPKQPFFIDHVYGRVGFVAHGQAVHITHALNEIKSPEGNSPFTRVPLYLIEKVETYRLKKVLDLKTETQLAK